MRTSRTYKLLLSDEGIKLFLACHHRLAQLQHDFISYGATRATAVMILETRRPREVIADLATLRFSRCLGDKCRFVGTSIALGPAIARIASSLTEANTRVPKTGHLYIAGLLAMSSARDEQLHAAYQQVAGAHGIDSTSLYKIDIT